MQMHTWHFSTDRFLNFRQTEWTGSTHVNFKHPENQKFTDIKFRDQRHHGNAKYLLIFFLFPKYFLMITLIGVAVWIITPSYKKVTKKASISIKHVTTLWHRKVKQRWAFSVAVMYNNFWDQNYEEEYFNKRISENKPHYCFLGIK